VAVRDILELVEAHFVCRPSEILASFSHPPTPSLLQPYVRVPADLAALCGPVIIGQLVTWRDSSFAALLGEAQEFGYIRMTLPYVPMGLRPSIRSEAGLLDGAEREGIARLRPQNQPQVEAPTIRRELIDGHSGPDDDDVARHRRIVTGRGPVRTPDSSCWKG